MRQLHDEEDPRAEAMRARADEVAETLEGTARDLDDESTGEERNNADFCERLDSLIFECATCNWWCGHWRRPNARRSVHRSMAWALRR